MKKLLALLLLCGAIDAQIIITLPNGLTAVPAPTFSPGAGTYTGTQSITISDSQGFTTCYYTINGSIPSPANYAGTGACPISGVTVASDLTINAIATASGYSASLQGSATYSINPPVPAGTPTFSPPASNGPFHSAPSVTISAPTAGSTVYYCTAISPSTCTATTGSTSCAPPCALSAFNTVGTTNLNAIATATSYTTSAAQAGAYVYQPPAATPSISPAAGAYVNSVTFTITGTTGCTIYYTVNNTPPTTASPNGASPLTATLLVNGTVQAMQTCTNYAQSAVSLPIAYTITTVQQAPTPTFSTPAHSPSPIAVLISDTAPAATIIYTVDGSVPSLTNGTSCSAPCGPTVSSTENVRAVATAAGYSTSAIGSQIYTISATLSACPASQGTLTVNVTTNRANGVSPLMIWNDATTTTDTGITANTVPFQDVTFTWSFGDGGPSGTGNWLYGSNPGKNSMNIAAGGVAAHLYRIVPGSADQTFRATVTATDGTNTVSCLAPVITVHDPQDAVSAGGFGGAATTCVSSSATPAPGVGGCPIGATAIKSATASGALSATFMGNNKQVLFHCGETYTGTSTIPVSIRAAIGAYGGCEGTQTNRPIFTGGINIPMNSGDVRVMDIDFENTSSGNAVISTNNYNYIPYQITLWNVNSSGNNASYYFPEESQLALIQTSSTGMGTQQGTFINYAGNNATQWGTNSAYNNLYYLAIMGGNYDGTGATNGSAGIETVRISQGQYEVIENNRFANANNVGATLKVHAANSKSDNPTFTGMYNEYVMNTDNLFTGTSGAQLVEYTPQNPVTDERLRYIVNERNIYAPTVAGRTGLALSAVNATVRDSACLNASQNCFQVASRGIEPTPAYDEVYNNSCSGSGTCIVLAAVDWASAGHPGGNSWIENNLYYKSAGGTTVSNSGSGNTVSNNTTNGNSGNNPAFVNASTTMMLMPDWIPTANYSGGTTVPVFFDALGTAWPPGWDLGAVSHQGTSSGATLLTMPSYTNLYGNTYASGVNGAISPTRGQTQIAPKNLPINVVWPLAERANPYAGSGADTYYWPNTWNAGQYTGFTPTNAAGHSQLSIQPSPASPTTTFQMEGAQFGAYILGSDAYQSSGRPQFTLQQNFLDNPVSGQPSGGPVLFTGSSTVLYNSIVLAAPTYVPAPVGPDTTNSPYIQVFLGLIPTPVPSPRSWELDIAINLLAGASETQAVHSFFLTQGPPDSYSIVIPFGASNCTYVCFTSGSYQTGKFSTPITFSWSISYAQMTNIIAYMIGKGYTAFNGLVPENFTGFQTHINAEQPNISTIAMGWNVTNWSMSSTH